VGGGAEPRHRLDGAVRKKDPKRLAFFTGRDQSQSLTGFWAMKYGTPNFAAHGGFCSVNMAAGGLYTFGGAFWEFGDPDWERIPSTSCCSAWRRITPPTPSRSASAS
jgi:anaerobic selenocysteine-containing dehydrogenase